VELISHLFSPQEALIACHLPLYFSRPVSWIARRAGRAPEEVAPLLEEMAQRRVIMRGKKGYALLPLVPGMFEHLLMNGAESPWHRRYAELFNALFATGYVRRYTTTKLPAIRNIPVHTAFEGRSRIHDIQGVYAMIEAHSDFAVLNVCQCRQSRHLTGQACRRALPEDGCLVFGSFALSVVAGGNGRPVSRDQMRAIARQRWEQNLVFMSANVTASVPNAICTCCDCCCHYVQAINDFGADSTLAPGPLLAEVDQERCIDCLACVKVCNTHAHQRVGQQHTFDRSRCIGCGLCLETCAPGAIRLRENPAYRPPSASYTRLGLRLLPGAALALLKSLGGRRSP